MKLVVRVLTKCVFNHRRVLLGVDSEYSLNDVVLAHYSKLSSFSIAVSLLPRNRERPIVCAILRCFCVVRWEMIGSDGR
jgi:hypothetical protein